MQHSDRESQGQRAKLADELEGVRRQLAVEEAAHRQADARLQVLKEAMERGAVEQIRELTAQYGLSLIAGQADSLDGLLHAAVEPVMSALSAHSGALVLFETPVGTDLPVAVRLIAQHSEMAGVSQLDELWPMLEPVVTELVTYPQPLMIPDISGDIRLPDWVRALGAQMLLLAPIWIEGRMMGLVALMRQIGPEPSPAMLGLLVAIAAQIGTAVERLELRRLDRELRMRAERERLARDLHDSVTQALYGLTALAEAGQAQLELGDLTRATRSLKRIAQTSRMALKEMRLFIHELRPNLLQQEGLVGALQLRLAAVEGRADTRVRLVADEIPKLSDEIEQALYRIAREALNNSMRHSCAYNVTVLLRLLEKEVRLEVTDDGLGFDPGAVPDGRTGLKSMRTLSAEIGARLEVASRLDEGTSVTVTVRFEDEE